ncbi:MULTISPECIES: phosphate ABC transporter permease subunit PstC [Acetobacter]|uniref:Phosphate transport system permease protein n=1 Tax=Acetobacter thailandicus TaxID=1502842 RepID=A0ABT3QGU3_9PROT|nr:MULTISPECIES: phosphate ABC transporter permease subunit PstC [Acetobacter]MBS0960779.1 phosphate ABC transporter permease subunit PstC [Acetobacter thailandicus]MBS0980887.1 phosphate ABC transporter permease subunit PstC [Acetobacter thailandicus]MBS0985857.1 phosphate ABC transporter permease subunit PstC [Acetobacter thailandicus]MCX2564504.1 phosphate ABC transporter permease subunit PstC [Acetobacter thailandicus]NHN96045.1 phosphate ABC transporter permease subunit PstC [Acetobacter 
MDVSTQQPVQSAVLKPGRPKTLTGDPFFRGLVLSAGVGVLLILGAVIVVMVVGGMPAFGQFGPGFLISKVWNPVTQHFGAAAPVFGTIASSVLALLIAVPLSFGTAFWLTTLAPPAASSVIGMAVQLLAAVPSIIFGMWGFFVLVPLVAHYVQPAAKALFGHVPVVSVLISGPPFGTGLFTAAVILAIMIMPSITAVMRDVFASIPSVLRESAYGLGATRWEVMRRVVLPWSRQGVVGGIVLGMGRAMGETMAVTFVIGDSNHIGWSIFAPANTIASLIALEFPESPAGSLKLASLMALGAILMAISFVTLWCSRMLLARGQNSTGKRS